METAAKTAATGQKHLLHVFNPIVVCSERRFLASERSLSRFYSALPSKPLQYGETSVFLTFPKNPMRIAFAGTPPFAAAALTALLEAGHEVALVLTQPDRPSGRGMKLKPSAVKEVALSHGIPVLTPESLSLKRSPEQAEEALSALENADVQVLVVAAYGLILPQRALDAARGIGVKGDIKSMNIHGSILPRWRGAAPVQRAIEAGDKTTGITLMKMEAGLDTGPMILTSETAITDEDTSATLFERLTAMGAELVVEALARPNTLAWTAQPEEGVTYAEKILKSEAPIDWSLPAETIARRIRAFNPFPFATAIFKGETFKVRNARPVEGDGRPGEVLVADRRLVVCCGSGALECTQLQRAGKPAMPAEAFVKSAAVSVGDVLQ